MSRSGYPPGILKRVGLESSGQRLIPSNGQTKRIAFLLFFYCIFFSRFFGKKVIFWDFSRLFFSGLGWTGELWLNCIFLILRRRKKSFLLRKIFFKTFRFWKKKNYVLRFWGFWTIFFLHFLDFGGFLWTFFVSIFFLDIFGFCFILDFLIFLDFLNFFWTFLNFLESLQSY